MFDGMTWQEIILTLIILTLVLVNRLITVWVVLECAKIKMYHHENHKLNTGARTTKVSVRKYHIQISCIQITVKNELEVTKGALSEGALGCTIAHVHNTVNFEQKTAVWSEIC